MNLMKMALVKMKPKNPKKVMVKKVKKVKKMIANYLEQNLVTKKFVHIQMMPIVQTKVNYFPQRICISCI